MTPIQREKAGSVMTQIYRGVTFLMLSFVCYILSDMYTDWKDWRRDKTSKDINQDIVLENHQSRIRSIERVLHIDNNQP